MDIFFYTERAEFEIQRFKAFWLDARALKPDDYPENMDEEDWIEQFEAWRELGSPINYFEMRTATFAPTGWKGVP